MNIRRIIREEIEKLMSPSPEVINIDSDEGNIFGVVHFDRERLNNWAEKERIQPGFDTIPDDELFPIGILKNINVSEEYRGQGVGGELFDNFMIECSHCQYVVLIADTGEENDFDIIDWYKRKGFAIFGESGGIPVMIKKINESIMDDTLNEGHTTKDSNYDFSPLKIWEKIDELKSIGSKLDSNYSDNIANLQVLSTGERSGRKLVEVGYPNGSVVLFYKSSKGTSGKEKGGWFPIPGFIDAPAPGLGISKGWFMKTSGVDNRYNVKTFQGTADYLKANEDNLGKEEIEEISLSIGHSPGFKPGQPREFPQKKEGGHSLNLSVDDGPHQFPKEEDF